jgi:4,5-DOPA dioxygenase extradiol
VWSPLILMRPEADIPVVQVSMPIKATPLSMYELGQTLAPLTQKGVALIGSGSLTHNLRDTRFGETRVLDYAQRFQDWVRGILHRVDALQGSTHGTATGAAKTAAAALLNPEDHTPDFKRAHPYDDHYLPLLFALGAAHGVEPMQRKFKVYDSPIMHAALSMESYCWSR